MTSFLEQNHRCDILFILFIYLFIIYYLFIFLIMHVCQTKQQLQVLENNITDNMHYQEEKFF